MSAHNYWDRINPDQFQKLRLAYSPPQSNSFGDNVMDNAQFGTNTNYMTQSQVDKLGGGGGGGGSDVDLGTMDYLNFGLKAFNAWQGYQGVKNARAANDIAKDELAFNKESWKDNMGMQLATLNDERARVNAHTGPGGFLDSSQYIAPYDDSKYGNLRDLAVA